jgi:hypothetical protein
MKCVIVFNLFYKKETETQYELNFPYRIHIFFSEFLVKAKLNLSEIR